MNSRINRYHVLALLLCGSVLIGVGLSRQEALNASAAPVADGAVLYKMGGASSSVLGRSLNNLPANMPHVTINKDVSDLSAMEFGNNIVHIGLQGSVLAAAVYTQRDFKGDCETVTTYRPELWSPSNTVGKNIQSIRLNATCVGATKDVPVVTDVTSVSDSSRDVRCPSGYTRRNQDLNEGAGGKFVYACVQFGPATEVKYVRGFAFGSGNEAMCSGANHWTGDLKDGTGSNVTHFRMCVVRDPEDSNTNQAVMDLDFIAQDSLFNPWGPRPCEGKLGHTGSKVEQGDTDFNHGAGGKYIYMCVGR